MHQCPICREELPNAHWRVLADHTACQKPAPPPEGSLITKGIDLLRSAVEGAIATMSPTADPKKLDE